MDLIKIPGMSSLLPLFSQRQLISDIKPIEWSFVSQCRFRNYVVLGSQSLAEKLMNIAIILLYQESRLLR